MEAMFMTATEKTLQRNNEILKELEELNEIYARKNLRKHEKLSILKVNFYNPFKIKKNLNIYSKNLRKNIGLLLSQNILNGKFNLIFNMNIMLDYNLIIFFVFESAMSNRFFVLFGYQCLPL